MRLFDKVVGDASTDMEKTNKKEPTPKSEKLELDRIRKKENTQKRMISRSDNIIPDYEFLFSPDNTINITPQDKNLLGNQDKIDATLQNKKGVKTKEKSKKSGKTRKIKQSKSKFLWKVFHQNIWKLLISLIFYIIKASPIWVMPIITANIINLATSALTGANNTVPILINAGILLLILLQNVPMHMCYAKMTDRMLRQTSGGLRSTVIRKLQHLSITYHKEMETGKIQSKFLKDIDSVDGLLSNIIKNIIPSVIGAVISIGISIYKSGTVTLFFLLIIPLNLLIANVFGKKIKANNRAYRIENENLSSKLTNMLEMLTVTKAHGLEDEEIDSLNGNIKKLMKKGLAVDKTTAYFGSWVWVFSNVLSGACLIFCAFLAINHKIQIGDIVLYQSLFSLINSSIQAVINSAPQLGMGFDAVDSVSEIMLNEDVENNKGKEKITQLNGDVTFKNVYYKYPNSDQYVIENFDLQVKAGECVAFVGASGSGKSTIMNMIIGFLHPLQGEVEIDGKSLTKLSLSEYRHFISVVPQNSILFSGSIKDNIVYGLPGYSDEELNRVVEMANITEFIKDMPQGIDTQIGEKGGKLSGGQKQRITIARALIRDPKILIMDEATSALDNISEYHVQKAIASLIKGRTTFIVAHRLSTIRDADRIVVMDCGKCVEIGTYDELMAKKGKFYELKNLNDMNYKQAAEALQ